MLINKAYKTELNPNKAQISLLKKSIGTARFAYNWGLSRRIEEYNNTGKSSSAIDQHKQLNKLKQDSFPWIYEVSKSIPQEALRDLDTAYKNFFRKCKCKKGKVGFPKFKSKHNERQSFRINSAIKVKPNSILIPKIGHIKLKEKNYIPTNKLSYNTTVSRKANRWFVSVLVKEDIVIDEISTSKVLGLDKGISNLAVDSDGTFYSNPKALKKLEYKLRRSQRIVSRRKKGGSNYRRAKCRLAKVHYHISNIRKDSIHKITSSLMKTKSSKIVIEDLNISGMIKNHNLAKAIADASMNEIDRQLVYKCNWKGIELQKADRWFPSSKRCSSCVEINSLLKLSDREWVCTNCGTIHNRDLNAALNLKWYGEFHQNQGDNPKTLMDMESLLGSKDQANSMDEVRTLTC